MTKGVHTRIGGRIVDVFAHRFVVETMDRRRTLADLGPKGAETFALRAGIEIVVEGEMKPSELKVSSISVKGGEPMMIAHPAKKEHRKSADHADADVALKAVKSAGFQVVGEPRRKPKHFEVLGRREGKLAECHVEFDGTIRKEKPVEAGDDKWTADIKSAA